MIKTELVAVCQQKTQERKANEYVQKNNRKRKQVKMRKTILYTIAVAFIVAGLGIVGNNDLESMGVNAKESETEISLENNEHETIGGTVFHKHIILCDDNYRRPYADNVYADNTRVVVEYDSKGTEDPGDDIVFDVREGK